MMDLTTVLKLEVENPPAGLVNLIQNPNGELGGWGWVTPLASSAMAGDSLNLKLTYSRSTSGASYFTSEFLPIAAGQYAAASYVQQSAGNAYHKVRFEWYDASKVLLSSSTQSALVNPSATATTYVAPTVAPASTAYLKLRIDLYTSGAANPTGANSFAFKNATLAVAAASGSLATIRTNLAPNPGIETAATGYWASSGGGTLTRSTTTARTGTASLRLQQVTAKAIGFVEVDQDGLGGSTSMPVTAGTVYTASVYLRAGATARNWGMVINWYNAAGSFITSSGGADLPSSAANWNTRISVTDTAPLGAVRADMGVINYSAITAGELHYFDDWLFEKGAALGAFFSGATAASGTKTYAWTGTANASSSTETDSLLSYIAPATYTDILGPATDIKIGRTALDVGSLSAIVRDTSLDPATAALLRPGRKVRVMALNALTAAYDVLFAGETANARVAYDLTREDSKQATITLTAYDANQLVANTTRTQGVGTINELPFVLEGAGIPWNVNGSGNQVPSATVVSTNDSSSALDQVALTRDSALGYAWITKEGILTAYDSRTADYYGNGDSLVDENVYSGLDVSFDTDDCINELLVSRLVYNSGTGQTDEITTGPYRDAASISQWGAHRPQQPFKVHGISAAGVAAYAASILTANKTPALRVNGVRIPIRTAADITETRALIDLYAVANVKNTAKGIDVRHRVTGITHDITPRRWSMGLTFAGVDSVASPASTPDNAPGAGFTTKTAIVNVPLLASQVNSATVTYNFPTAFSSAPTVVCGSMVNSVLAARVTAVTASSVTLQTYWSDQGAAHSAVPTLPVHVIAVGPI